MQICLRPLRPIRVCQACPITNRDTVWKKSHWILSRGKFSCRKQFGDVLLALLTSSGNIVLLHVNFRWPTIYSDFEAYCSWLEGLINLKVTKMVLNLCTYGWLKCQLVCTHPRSFCSEKAPKSPSHTVLCTGHLLAYSQWLCYFYIWHLP